MDEDWRRLQDSLVGAANEVVPREPQGGRQPWMTEEILELMEERKKVKNVSGNRYKELDRIIRIECKERREKWLQAKCNEVKQLERMDARLMAEEIREIAER